MLAPHTYFILFLTKQFHDFRAVFIRTVLHVEYVRKLESHCVAMSHYRGQYAFISLIKLCIRVDNALYPCPISDASSHDYLGRSEQGLS